MVERFMPHLLGPASEMPQVSGVELRRGRLRIDFAMGARNFSRNDIVPRVGDFEESLRAAVARAQPSAGCSLTGGGSFGGQLRVII
jgi:hypothetical protein